MGARAVPAGGFAVRSRAAWASCLPALRPGWEVHPWTGTGEGSVERAPRRLMRRLVTCVCRRSASFI
jgi:hypothetical protein